MTPLEPTDPTPRLVGCGVNVHIPGHEVTLPRSPRRWLLAEDVVVEEAGEVFRVAVPDLPAPVEIPREDVVAAAAGVANLIAARLHDARSALRVLDEAILPECDSEAIGNTVANALLDGRGES